MLYYTTIPIQQLKGHTYRNSNKYLTALNTLNSYHAIEVFYHHQVRYRFTNRGLNTTRCRVIVYGLPPSNFLDGLRNACDSNQ